MPMWQEPAQNPRIVGVISIKPLLYSNTIDPKKIVGDFLKPASYLGEDTRLEEALRSMQRSGQRQAIVLGRNGREVGVICLQDILRFIFGEVNL